jgi:hypothetical protein
VSEVPEIPISSNFSLYHALWSYENGGIREGYVKATLKAISSSFHLEIYLFTAYYAIGERLKAVL